MSNTHAQTGPQKEQEFLAICERSRRNSDWSLVRKELALVSLYEDEFLVFRIYAWAMLEAAHSGRPLLIQWIVASAWLSGHNLALEFARRAESFYLGFIGNREDRILEMRLLCNRYEQKILEAHRQE